LCGVGSKIGCRVAKEGEKPKKFCLGFERVVLPSRVLGKITSYFQVLSLAPIAGNSKPRPKLLYNNLNVMVALVDFCLQWLVVVGLCGSCSSRVSHAWGLSGLMVCRDKAQVVWSAWMSNTRKGPSRLIPWYAC